ncbi:phytanoyl-CoA dioxygenase family protein [Alphaproteobacteria bacterium]|nr:phytanoyl-CoA dioxygenase family protein [Alphaproteobacteria bacterium]
MTATGMRDITAEEQRAFEEDGVVHLRGLFNTDWIEMLRGRAAHVMKHPGKMSYDLARDDGKGRFFTETFLWHRDEAFKRFVHDSPAAGLAGQVMDSARMNIVFDQFLIKEAGSPEPTVWHHDLTYWPIKGKRVATLWLALDEVTEDSGSMEFVKGSHKWGKRFHPVAFVDPEKYKTKEPPVPDIDAMRDELEFIRFDYEPGDCTIHHALMVHAAGGNSRKDRSRRAYATRWAGDDVVYDPRPNIQPMLWDPDLAPGAPLDSTLWPCVWER